MAPSNITRLKRDTQSHKLVKGGVADLSAASKPKRKGLERSSFENDVASFVTMWSNASADAVVPRIEKMHMARGRFQYQNLQLAAEFMAQDRPIDACIAIGGRTLSDLGTAESIARFAEANGAIPVIARGGKIRRATGPADIVYKMSAGRGRPLNIEVKAARMTERGIFFMGIQREQALLNGNILVASLHSDYAWENTQFLVVSMKNLLSHIASDKRGDKYAGRKGNGFQVQLPDHVVDGHTFHPFFSKRLHTMPSLVNQILSGFPNR